jgi:hypothetical protein
MRRSPTVRTKSISGSSPRAGSQATPIPGIAASRLPTMLSARKVLDLVEDQVDRLATPSPGIERAADSRAAEDVVLVPQGQAQDRHAAGVEVGELVELDVEDPSRIEILDVQQVVDDLTLQDGLADLAGTAQDGDRRQAAVQPVQHRLEEPAVESSGWGIRFASPPRVLGVQKRFGRSGQTGRPTLRFRSSGIGRRRIVRGIGVRHLLRIPKTTDLVRTKSWPSARRAGTDGGSDA